MTMQRLPGETETECRDRLAEARRLDVHEELPIPVVPDWEEQVRRATVLCRLVDAHVEYEAAGRILERKLDFRPNHLCPEQRAQMVTDLYAALR
jgi:hypothetical protein